MERDLFPSDPAEGGAPSSRWYLSRGELAELLGLSVQMLHKLEKDGMPKAARNRYDAAACVQWYVGTWRERAQSAGTADSPEGKRYHAARALRAELELKAYASELVEAQQAVEVLNQVAAIFVSATDNLASRYAGELAAANTPPEVEAILDDERHRIRAVVSERITAFARTLDGRGDSQTAG